MYGIKNSFDDELHEWKKNMAELKGKMKHQCSVLNADPKLPSVTRTFIVISHMSEHKKFWERIAYGI